MSPGENGKVWMSYSVLLRRLQEGSVDYYFNHPSFKNPKHSEAGSNIFLAKWNGYGCVESAYVVAKLTSGKRVRADFDFCEVVNRGGRL